MARMFVKKAVMVERKKKVAVNKSKDDILNMMPPENNKKVSSLFSNSMEKLYQEFSSLDNTFLKKHSGFNLVNFILEGGKSTANMFKSLTGVSDEQYKKMNELYSREEMYEEIHSYLFITKKRLEDEKLKFDELPIYIFGHIADFIDIQSLSNLSSANSRLNLKLRPYRRMYIPLVLNIPKKISFTVSESKKHLFFPVLSDLKKEEVMNDYKRTKVLILNTISVKENDGNIVLSNLVKSKITANLWDHQCPSRNGINFECWSIEDKTILFASAFDNLTVMKVCITDLRLLLNINRIQSTHLTSLLINITAENLVCNTQTRDQIILLKSWNVAPKFKLKSFVVDKTYGRGIFSYSAYRKLLSVSYENLVGIDLTDPLIDIQENHHVDYDINNSITHCLRVVLTRTIILHSKSLEYIQMSNIDATVIFGAIKVPFPQLLNLNVCMLSLPMIDTWLPRLIAANRNRRIPIDEYNKPFSRSKEKGLLPYAKTFIVSRKEKDIYQSVCVTDWEQKDLKWVKAEGTLWHVMAEKSSIPKTVVSKLV